MAGWNSDTAAGPLGAGTVTFVERSSSCISLPNGDIEPEHPHGAFVQDTRILSGWSLTINGQKLEPLAAEAKKARIQRRWKETRQVHGDSVLLQAAWADVL